MLGPLPSVVDLLPQLIWTYESDGSLASVNHAWLLHTGVSVDDARERAHWRLLLERGTADAFVAALDDALGRGATFRCETRIRHRDDPTTFRWYAILVEPHRDAAGELRFWLGTATDVEDRRRAELALLLRERQYEREQAKSTLFQRAALPPNLPAVAGLTFDAVYEPGQSDEKVGGDWYDAVRLLDGRVMLAIGDVSGSGLKAAVVMGVVRQIMRGIAQLHAEPALMLDAADRALRLEYPETIVTAWVGVLDLVGRTLTYASAGHPPPLLIDADGRIRELDHLTLPLGLRQGHQGFASTVAIDHGSALWLYTDGLIEAGHDIVAGSQRLYEAAARLGTTNVVRPAATLRHFVIPDGSPDDVAILVVKTNFVETERSLTRWSFESSDETAAREARRRFAASLPIADYSANDVANAEIVFGELCGNVARHAPGRIDIVVDRSGVQTVLHVLDRGVGGFRHLSRLPCDPYSEIGRGLFLVASMTTEFTVAQRPGGGSEARAVLVGRYPVSLLRERTLPATSDQVAANF